MPLFASESRVKSDGGGLSDFATGPSPFPDTPWHEAQDRRNSVRPGFSSGCACNINRPYKFMAREPLSTLKANSGEGASAKCELPHTAISN